MYKILADSFYFIVDIFTSFRSLPNTGDGDTFMSPEFQQTLTGSNTHMAGTPIGNDNIFTPLIIQGCRKNGLKSTKLWGGGTI